MYCDCRPVAAPAGAPVFDSDFESGNLRKVVQVSGHGRKVGLRGWY